MKIGVVTFSDSLDNYGEVLQYLATQKYLSDRGHDVVLLKEPESFSIRTFLRKLKNSLKSAIKQTKNEKGELFKKWHAVTLANEKKHPRNFESFRRQFFNINKGTISSILDDGFDCYVTGSDQVWAYPSSWYMLAWTPDSAKRISIAPSIGHGKYSDGSIILASSWLKRYNFITVRESNGVDVCNKCHISNVYQILDPTFLLRDTEYSVFYKDILLPTKPYIFVYLLGAEISIDVQSIIDFAKRNSYEVKYVESQGRNESIADKTYPEVGQWLYLIRNSSYVITNSFHGMALSIIHHKPFVVLPISGIMSNMNSRIESTTKKLHLEERIYSGDMNRLFTPIDWSVSDRIIMENRMLLNKLMKSIEL